MLANDVSLRNLIPAELAKGFGFFQSKPATAFSPVAVTLDELGDAWDNGPRAPDAAKHLERPQGRHVRRRPGNDLPLWPTDRPHGKTRNVRAGSIVGSGTVSNKGVTDANGKTDWPKGYSCIAEKRAIETIQDGKPSTDVTS
jgi:fumarylacetoacetate (FAA) hydrolase